MSSGQKSCYEDDLEWEDFKLKVFKLKVDLGNVPWKSTDAQARWAREIYNKEQFTGSRLLLEVQHKKEHNELAAKQRKELEEFKKLLELREKFKDILE